MVARMRRAWASLGVVLALASGVSACSTQGPQPERTGSAAGTSTRSPTAAETSSSTPAGYVSPSARLPIQTFSGDDAATVTAIKAGLGSTTTTQLKDQELVALAKGACSVASSGGAVASKIDFWAAYSEIPGELREVVFSVGSTAYCPRFAHSVADSRAQQEALGDGYVPALPLEAQTDLTRFALTVVNEKIPTSLTHRSDAQMALDMRAVCDTWANTSRLGALEAAVNAPSSETYAALDIYVAFLMLGHCNAEYKEYQSALQNTPAPDKTTGRHS